MSESKKCYMPIPAGTPYSILSEAAVMFDLELVEKEVEIPGSAEAEMLPKIWALSGERENLLKAKEYIIKKLDKKLERFK